jgi:hypothetical protein
MTYILYINDSPYGIGDLKYVHELIIDYLLNCNMYGKEQVKFEIKKKVLV